MKLNKWLDHGIAVDQITKNLRVVREDHIPGGTKLRFLPYLCKEATEIVYASPFCGGAQVALAAMGQITGQRIIIFVAKRKEYHQMQHRAANFGADFVEVPYGYLSNVESKARAYAQKTGALLIPFGFDVPEAVAPYSTFVERLRGMTGDPDEVWCAAGSGMISRCIARGFPNSKIVGVAIGKDIDMSKAPPNAHYIKHPMKFERELNIDMPFPSSGNYDRKAWQMCSEYAGTHRKKSILFLNIMG